MRFKKFLILAFTMVVAWCGLGISSAVADAYNMPYYIDVDITNQIVTVYNAKDDSIARQMLCSTGMNDRTPTGTWYMPAKERGDERTEWYHMKNAGAWVKYPTKIYYAYFFHSLTYSKADDSCMNQDAIDNYGVPASHGCIRLRIDDAKFIADNCLRGTRVRIFKSGTKNEPLRELLYVSTYRDDEGITYQEFLGISKDALSAGSSGSEVEDLQLRLRDLGYYDGKIDGSYATDTIIAVKELQKDLGLAQSGITSVELKEIIFSDDAPVSKGQITIQEGSSGPVVKQFQEELQRLGVYDGDIDSVYDAEVVDAVKELQRLCGYDQDGIATPEIQYLAYYEINRMEAELGADFVAERVVEEINMATMIFKKSKINVRSQPNTKSSTVGQLKYGAQVLLTATKGEWAQIVVNGKTGYLNTKYLEPFTKENYVMKYSSASSNDSITLGRTLEETLSGEGTDEREAFRKNYRSVQLGEDQDATVEFVTVNTGSNDVKLNLRIDSSSDSEVLGQVPNGTNLRVLAKEDEWTRVGYDGEIGWLMNAYLTFWEGKPSDVEDTADEDVPTDEFDEKTAVKAVIMPQRKDGTIPLYRSANTNSKVITTLGYKREVWVLSVDEDTGWASVYFGGKRGYMQDKYLSHRISVEGVILDPYVARNGENAEAEEA